MKVLCEAFIFLQLHFEIFFGQKEIGAKAACKMLVKLTNQFYQHFANSFFE